MGVCFLFKQSFQRGTYGKKVAGAGNMVISPGEIEFELFDPDHGAEGHPGAAGFGFGAQLLPAQMVVAKSQVEILTEHKFAAHYKMPRQLIAEGFLGLYFLVIFPNATSNGSI